MYYVVTGTTLAGLNGLKPVLDDLPTGLNRFQVVPDSHVSYPHPSTIIWYGINYRVDY